MARQFITFITITSDSLKFFERWQQGLINIHYKEKGISNVVKNGLISQWSNNEAELNEQRWISHHWKCSSIQQEVLHMIPFLSKCSKQLNSNWTTRSLHTEVIWTLDQSLIISIYSIRIIWIPKLWFYQFGVRLQNFYILEAFLQILMHS